MWSQEKIIEKYYLFTMCYGDANRKVIVPLHNINYIEEIDAAQTAIYFKDKSCVFVKENIMDVFELLGKDDKGSW